VHNGHIIWQLSANINISGKPKPAAPTHLPDVEHLLVVTQESPSPDKALTGYTWISYADTFYLALDITDGSNRGDRNLKGMRIGG
jgi:hypothetical protein